MGFLTNAQMERLLLGLAKVRGDRGFTEDEAKTMTYMVEEMALGAKMFEFLMDGTVLPDAEDGALYFRSAKEFAE